MDPCFSRFRSILTIPLVVADAMVSVCWFMSEDEDVSAIGIFWIAVSGLMCRFSGWIAITVADDTLRS